MTPHECLETRVRAAPEPLRSGLASAIERLDDGPDLAERLVDLAIERIEEVRERLDHRDGAFDLLVADGLLTLACEVAALSRPTEVADRCRLMGPAGRLGELARTWAAKR